MLKIQGRLRDSIVSHPTRSDHLAVILRFLIVAGGDLMAKAIGFAATIILIRHFGSAAFGTVSFAGAVAVWAISIASGGTELLAIKTVSVSPETVGPTAAMVMIQRLLASVIVAALLVPLCFLIPAFRPYAGIILLFNLSLATQAINLDWSLQSLQKPTVLAGANFSVQALIFVLLLAAIQTPSDLWVVPATQVAGEALVSVALIFWMGRYLKNQFFFLHPIPVQEWRAFFVQALPIGGARLMRGVALSADVILLGLMLPMREVGWYSGAYRLFLSGLSLGFLYFVILFPQLAKKAAESNTALRQEVAQSFKRIIPVAVVVMIAAMFGARWILGTLYGPAFQAATLSLQVLLFAILVGLISNHFRQIMIAQNRQTTDFRIASISSIVHILAKLALIPFLGILGAAVGSVIGELTNLILGFWATRSLWNDSDASEKGGNK